jgi:hypothetical protein
MNASKFAVPSSRAVTIPAPRMTATLAALQSLDDPFEGLAVDELHELDKTMCERTACLEQALCDVKSRLLRYLMGSFVGVASVLRELLVRIAGEPAPVQDLVPPFETLLAEPIRWTYLWAIHELEWLCLVAEGNSTRTRSVVVPAEVTSGFRDLLELCDVCGVGEHAGGTFATTLPIIEDAVSQLTGMADRIDCLLA